MTLGLGLYFPAMTRLFLVVINVLVGVCMLLATPILFVLLLGIPVVQGARALARKIKHRQLGWVRTRRRTRTNIYPETAI